MSKSRWSLVAGAVAAGLFLGACGSGEDSTADTIGGDETTETTAGVGTSTTAASDDSPDSTDVTETTLGATETELPNPCEMLTAEEFNVVTGLDATAEVDEFLTSMCTYLDAEGTSYASLTVGSGPTSQAVIGGFLTSPPPGAVFHEVSGIGESAVVSDLPEGRAVMVSGGVGYDFSKGFGAEALPPDQLEELLRSIVAE